PPPRRARSVSAGLRSVVLVETEADLHRDLVPTELVVVHRAADPCDLEPADVAQRLRRARERAADGVVDALPRRPDNLGDPVHVLCHRHPPVHALVRPLRAADHGTIEKVASLPRDDSVVNEPTVDRPFMPGYGTLPAQEGSGLLSWDTG